MQIKKTDADILALLENDIRRSKQYQTELSAERDKFYKWYRAESYGNERPGWSQTVHPTIFSVVEWMKPGLVDVFTGDFFQFKPLSRQGEDPKESQDRAHRLKQYIRFKLFSQLDGEQVIEDFIHDCLTNHYGVFKVVHRDDWDIETIDVQQITDQELQGLQDQDPNFIEAHVGEGVQSADPATMSPVTVYRDVTLVRKVQRYVGPSLEVVPARELYMLPGYPDMEKNPFVAHVVRRDLDYIRRQELAGVYRHGTYDAVKAKADNRKDLLESQGEMQTQAMVDNLTSGVFQTGADTSDDPMKVSANEVWVWECYSRLDLDGSGLLKPCIVTLCEDVVLREPVENPYGSPPFELGYIYKEPHKAIGRSMASILDSRQRVMSNLLRGIQDSAAMSTYRGFLTTDQRTKRAIANMGPGDVAQVTSLGESSIMPIDPGAPNEFIMEAFALTSQEVAKETGINENQQGLDANSLNKTAAAMEMRLTAGMQRQKLYAKRIARTFRRALRRVLDIMRKFPPDDDVNAVGVDLALQPGDMDGLFSVDIDVGVGPQDRMYYAQGMDQLVQWQCTVGMQMGVVTPDMVIKALKAKYDYLDMDVSEFLPDPDQAPGIASLTQQYQQLASENQALKQAIEEARYQDALKSEENRLKELGMERDFVIKARQLFIQEQDLAYKRETERMRTLTAPSAASPVGPPAHAVPGAHPPAMTAHPCPPMGDMPHGMHGPGTTPGMPGMEPGEPMGGEPEEEMLEQAINAQALADIQKINQAPPVPMAPPIDVTMDQTGNASATAPKPQQAGPPQQGPPQSPLPR